MVVVGEGVEEEGWELGEATMGVAVGAMTAAGVCAPVTADAMGVQGTGTATSPGFDMTSGCAPCAAMTAGPERDNQIRIRIRGS